MNIFLDSNSERNRIGPKRSLSSGTNRLSYSVRRYFVDEFYFRYIPSLPKGTLVLDLGGHKDRKRGRFNIGHYNFRVIYSNMTTEKGADVQADAAQLPFNDDYFDTIICAELLEHVWNPEAVLREVFRLLNKQGTTLISVPFLHRIHADPYDYGRYTDYYWSSLLQQIGFNNILIERQGLFFSVLVNFLKEYANQMHFPQPFGRITRWIISTVILSPLHHWSLTREQKPNVNKDLFLGSYTTGFGILATKE